MKPYCIRKPLITEKTLALANLSNTYTFLVDRTATKEQVKAAVEAVFGKEVLRVRTILNAALRKRTGKKRVVTQFAKEKKALVTLKAGQTIDLFDVSNQA